MLAPTDGNKSELRTLRVGSRVDRFSTRASSVERLTLADAAVPPITLWVGPGPRVPDGRRDELDGTVRMLLRPEFWRLVFPKRGPMFWAEVEGSSPTVSCMLLVEGVDPCSS